MKCLCRKGDAPMPHTPGQRDEAETHRQTRVRVRPWKGKYIDVLVLCVCVEKADAVCQLRYFKKGVFKNNIFHVDVVLNYVYLVNTTFFNTYPLSVCVEKDKDVFVLVREQRSTNTHTRNCGCSRLIERSNIVFVLD